MTFLEKYQDKLTPTTDKQMLISKEDFVNLFNELNKKKERYDKVADGLEQLIDGYACINIDSDFDAAVLNLIAKLTGDTEDVIGWWLYENVEKIVTVTKISSINKIGEDVPIEITTIEDLYDYLQYFVY